MKLQNIIAILVLTSLVTTFKAKCDVYQEDSEENQILTEEEINSYSENREEILESFFAPIQFSKNGIQCFVQHTFNHREYKEFLPHNLDHMKQFLSYGIRTNQSQVYPLTVIRLFMSKLKESEYVNGYAFSGFMKEAPSLLNVYFKEDLQKRSIQDLLQKIKNIIY